MQAGTAISRRRNGVIRLHRIGQRQHRSSSGELSSRWTAAKRQPGCSSTLSIANTSVTADKRNFHGSIHCDFVAASPSAVTVSYATADAPLTRDRLHGRHGTLTFAPGQTQQTISVPALTDSTAYGDQTFTVNLTNPNGATLSQGQATATIDDPAHRLVRRRSVCGHQRLGTASTVRSPLRTRAKQR